jgi:hypothetical protein
MGDDVPYLLSMRRGELVELPVSWASDDWPPYVHSIDLDYMFQILPPERAMEVFMAEFEAACAVGGALWIGVWHPFVSGRLSRWLRIENQAMVGRRHPRMLANEGLPPPAIKAIV